MANPQTENGFVMIALDLFAALCRADWTDGEWAVLCEVLMQVFGPDKARRRTAYVAVRELVRYSGVEDKNIYRALRNLKKWGVLREHKDGSFFFVKDFEAWRLPAERPGGEPTRRLTGGDLKYALAANGRFGLDFPIKTSKPKGGQPATDGGQPATSFDDNRWPTSHQFSPELVANQPPPIIEDTRASEELETLETLETHENSRVREGGEPFHSEGVELPTRPKGPGKDSPEALALADWASQFGADRNLESYAHWAREACTGAPAAMVRRLLDQKVKGRSGTGRAAIPLLNSILARWLDEGEPQPARFAVNGHASPSSPEERERRKAESIARMKGGR